MDNFANSEDKSSDKSEIVIYTNGVPTKVSAASKNHVVKKYVLKYTKPEIYHKDGTEIIGAKDTWLEMVNFINQDYDWLLKLPLNKFWLNIIFYHPYLDSVYEILKKSPRFYELSEFPDDDQMREAFNSLHKRVINIFTRIVTRKISTKEFISNEHHASLIYNHFLMTVPIMMQLCQLFGRKNQRVIFKIIKNAVEHQPRYHNDFKELVSFSCQVLGEMEEKLLNRQEINTMEKDVLYISRVNDKSNEITSEEIEDMIIYLMDFTSSVEILLTVYPPTIDYFLSDYFLMKITSIYENVFPELYRRLEKSINKKEDKENYLKMKKYLEIARLEIIKIFRTITFRGISSILEQPEIIETTVVKESVDQFLNYLTSAVSDKHLMIDYNQTYPIVDDLELIHQITSDVDQIKESFLRRLITELVMNYSPKTTNNIVNDMPNPLNPVAGPSGVCNSTNSSSAINPRSINKIELQSLISNVKDVMYDLGEGFIQKCLQYYDYNTEAVINAILEDSLPSEIKQLDRQLPYTSFESMNLPTALTQGIECLTIDDGNVLDENIQETNDTDDIVEVLRGKRKSQYRNLNEMLNDKSFKNKVAESYSKYSIVEGYDDEYDDTYDSQNDGVVLLDDQLEIDFKPFTTPRVFRVNEKLERLYDDNEENEDEEEPSTSNGLNNKNNFVQDPAVLRARAEQRKQSFQERGKKGRKKNEDVVGNPKGQGNDKTVLMSRDKKNTQKASRANHNRRSGAEWKRRQGMVPS